LSGPDDILPTYERVADGFARDRSQMLFERGWLTRLTAGLGPAPRVLDVGCGTGRPLAVALAADGCRVTGVDGAAAMLVHFRAALPGAEAIHADMRTLALGRTFDAVMAWHSFFHLSPEDQRRTLPRLAAHVAPGGRLMFTSGPGESEAIGQVDGAPVYHASLAPDAYGALLEGAGLAVEAFVPEDPECDYSTIWLATRPA
jgi:SAM-dependent methyltransferase